MGNFFKNFSSFFFLICSLFIYFFFKKNSKIGHQVLVRAYVLTGGLSNKIISKFISFFSLMSKKIIYYDGSSKIFEKKNENNLILDDLFNEGYSIFKNKISRDHIDFLISFAKNNEGFFLKNREIVSLNYKNFDFSSAVFNYNENILLDNFLVRKIAINSDFLEIASAYFDSVPILSAVNMWWSIPSTNVDSDAGQLYHFDMDRIKFLKFFIYLTDVDYDSGPHCYVSGTHKPFSKKKLLNRGYQRIPDGDIQQNYTSESIRSITGSAGTIIVGDTSCFHKGLPPRKSSRLILEFEYSNCLFGAETEKILDATKNKLKNDIAYKSLLESKSKTLLRYC